MKKIITTSLSLSLLFTAALSIQAQTRPRRVGQTASFSESTSSTREVEQQSVADGRMRTVRRSDEGFETTSRRRGKRWAGFLLQAGIAVGIASITRGSRSCTPSRDVIGEMPRVTTLPR